VTRARTLEIGDLTTAHGRWTTALRLQAVMLFPHDPAEQARLLAALGGQVLTSPRLALDPAPAAFRSGERLLLPLPPEQASELHEQHGGLAAVVEAEPTSSYRQLVDERLGAWFTAGSVLSLLLGLAALPEFRGRASVRMAVFVLEHARKFPDLMPATRTQIKAAWSAYRDVAHLCAAYLDLCYGICRTCTDPIMRRLLVNEFLLNETREFLESAAAYEIFGLGYQLPKTKGRTLLDPDTLYRVPLVSSGTYRIEPPRLAEPVLAIARRYAT
jgi:hypothetical protein